MNAGPHDLGRLLTRCAVLLAAIVALSGPPAAAQETDPDVLLEQARYEETVRGDLDAAIRLYRRVVDEHGDRRDVAARALLALGAAYERVGRDDAREAYRRVVTEYGDQVETAQAARARLAALATEAPVLPSDPPGLEMRRLWTTAGGISSGAVSPDARRILFVDWGEVDDPGLRGQADVAFHDVVSGRASLVTHLPDQSVEATYPSVPIWSRDGRWIAYAHWDDDWTHQRLHVVRPDGSDNRVLVDNEQFADLRPLDFSSTGDFVVALITGWDDAQRIAVVSTEDGDVTILKTGGTHPPHPLSLSPDDRWIVFDQHQGDGSDRHDIFALAVDGSQEVTLVESPAEDHLPYWSPDGRAVVFVSDRSGRPALWSVPVEEGRPAGAPRLLRDDVGDTYPLGFTAEGALAYRTRLWRTDAFTAELDLEKGELGEPRLLTPDFVGTNMLPAWSPDGERVAFVSRRGPAADEYHLVIRHFASGEERAHALPFTTTPGAETTWSEDGTGVYLEAGSDWWNRRSYRVDVESGRVEEVERRDWVGMPGHLAFANQRQARHLDSLGLRVVGLNEIRRFEEGDARLEPEETLLWIAAGVRRLPDGPGGEVEALTPVGHSHTWRLSPDGTTWALSISVTSPGMVSDGLFLLPTGGGEAREIDRTEGGEREFVAVRWTPDGERLLYAEHDQEAALTKFWTVEVDGGEPRQLDLDLTTAEFGSLRFHPDGKSIVFTREEQLREVWLMAGVEWED